MLMLSVVVERVLGGIVCDRVIVVVVVVVVKRDVVLMGVFVCFLLLF